MSNQVSRRDWWLGVLIVAVAVLLHAAWPRYDWRHVVGGVFVRINHWTGAAVIGRTGADRQWTPDYAKLTITKQEP